MMKRKGSILYFVIVLVTAMIFMSFGLTQRMSSHTQIITLNDYTQTARYFLESYVGDVIQHIRKEANNPNSQLYEDLRSDNPPNPLRLGYKFEGEIKKLENGDFLSSEGISLAPDAKIAHDGDPQARIVGNQEELQSNAFTYGEKKEYKGLIEITCKCKFREKNYTLTVTTPYTVVYRMLPVLKDFQLFVDNFSKEQGNDKIGRNDKINTMFSYNGYYSKCSDCGEFDSTFRDMKIDSSYNSTPKRPLVLLSLNKDTADTSDELDYGQVFLGSSDESIFLNLSGGKVYNADNAINNYMPATEVDLMCLPSFLGFQKGIDFEGEDKFVRKGFIDKPGGGQIDAPLIMIPMKYNIKVKYSLQGFSHEIVYSLTEIGDTTRYKFDDFLKDLNGSDFTGFVKTVGQEYGFYSLSSGLKLFGYVPLLIANNDGAAARPGKKIYGNIYGRYFVLSIAQHGLYPGRPLKYSSTDYDINSMQGFETYTSSDSGNRTIPIEFPSGSQLNYNKVMSRMMSGSKEVAADNNLSMPMNYDSDTGASAIIEAKPNKFSSKDGTKNILSLDNYGENYLDLSKTKSINDRIGRKFDSQEEFEEEVGLTDSSKKSFQINGVVYVKGDLDLSNKLEGITNENIGGGIIIADGKITLGNINRGEDLYSEKITFSPDYVNSKAFKLHENWIKGGTKAEYKLTQDKVLTFVSLSQDENAITIKGNALIGVQLVALNKKQDTPYTQIKWEPDISKEIIFLGGIACNYLNLDETVKAFGKIKEDAQCKLFHAPFFMYHPDMATSTPSLAVQIPQNLASYKLYASKD